MKNLKIILCCSIIFIILFLSYNQKSKYSEDVKEITGTLWFYQMDGNQLKMEIYAKEKVLVNYYFQTEQEKLEFPKKYHLGDVISFIGEFRYPSTNRNFHLFNYQNYLKSKKINWIFASTKINFQRKNTNILFILKENILKRIDQKENSMYLKYLLLGDDSKMEDIFKQEAQSLGISHLFAISGMHIHLLVAMILWGLKKLTNKKWIHFLTLVFFLGFYSFLTNFSPSIVRASSFFLLLFLKKWHQLSISSFFLLVIVCVAMLIYNPYYCYHLGFVFSFLISFSLLYFSKYQIKQTKWKQLFITTWISFWMGVPILIKNFFTVNFLTPIWNLFFVPFVSIFLFPTCVLCLFIPVLNPILDLLLLILNFSMKLCNQLKIFQISFSTISFPILLFYYVIIIILLRFHLKRQYKYWFFMIIILFVHYHIHDFDSRYKLTMIDVGQGDSILMELPHNRGNILIDTGGTITYQQEEWKQKKSSYSIGTSILIPYMRSIGIHCLDALILSHGDVDHMKEASILINQFCVKKIIMNSGNLNKLENELYEIAKKKNIPILFISEQTIEIGDEKFYFLNKQNRKNENEDSLIMYTKWMNTNILLMGDAGEETEKKLLTNYHLPKIDLLKVGHHGSNGGTSQAFLNQIQPKYAFISVGVNNKYHHPHQEVLKRLQKNSLIYRTDTYGMVQFILEKNLRIKTRYLAR